MSKVQPVKRRKPKGSEAVPYDKVPFDVPGRTLEEMIANGYVLETFVGAPRPDGIPWSEIEGLPE
jgi:hypothetical protein